ncbi:hypothetical protein [Paenibacillus sp. NPDC058071]|uniref:hypothetical protein n=1 Tax=Paenibacillus sp. NPDC058071 TaxID=3346326 RepID=UPI0036D8857F
MNTIVTCKCIGNYVHAITKGKSYEVIESSEDKFRISGNHGRRVWISKDYFIEGNIEIPILNNWRLDDDINEYNLIEVTLMFTNKSRRWCLITTPDKLKNYFNERELEPPGINIQHLIIVKTLTEDIIERTLLYLDNQDELFTASKPLE